MPDGRGTILLHHLLRHAGGKDLDGVPDGELLRRFARERHEASFAASVHRHGPMVWGACRRVLPSPHDAEDAFQATFLTLARRVARPWRDSVAGWLHTVAYRLA